MQEIAKVFHGFSDYDDRFHALLGEYDSRIMSVYNSEMICPDGIDYGGLFAVFMIAGAQIITVPMDQDRYFSIRVDNVDRFLISLDKHLKRHLTTAENMG